MIFCILVPVAVIVGVFFFVVFLTSDDPENKLKP